MAKPVKSLPRMAEERIISKINLVRGKKIMLDFDLAEMYDVETKQLKRQVRRNIERFPSDFMFELTLKELKNLRSQIGTSSWGGTRYRPMAFTGQGVAMLSAILNSPSAILVSIKIIRVFTRMRELILSNKNMLLRLQRVEERMNETE